MYTDWKSRATTASRVGNKDHYDASSAKVVIQLDRHSLAKAFLFESCFLAFLFSAQAQVNVTTYHYDNARDGQNLSEFLLTPANVNPVQFGKMFVQPVDGYIYAQPLYVSGLQIAGCVYAYGCVHNVVFVATENDSVYAFDADSNAGANASPLWHVSFINPAAGITTVNSLNDAGCGDLIPEIGITGTPVIDLSSNTLYVVANTKENGTFFQRLHALDIASGAEKFGGPVVIQATVPGTGAGQSGGQISFDPLRNGQRPGILLQNGLVYIAWASHCDLGPFHGWVMAYDAQSLQQVAVWNSTTNGSDGGVWQSGAAPAADSNGNVFLATGNGTFDLNTAGPDAGDTILKLGPASGGTFPILDYFTPYNQASLSAGDTDLGSGGAMLFPDLPAGSAHQYLLTETGKQGTLYLVDRDNMGHFNASGDTQIVQSLPNVVGGLYGTPAFWNNTFYVGGANDALKAFSFDAGNSGLLSDSPVSSSPETYYFPGTTPSISASGSTNGLVWALEEDDPLAVLRVYNAANLSSELYNSNQNPKDSPGPSVKFAVPTVVNGKVYVGTASQLAVFGLVGSLPSAPVLLTPVNDATGVGLFPVLTWTTASGATSYDIYYGSSSPPPLLGNQTSAIYAPPEQNSATTYYWMIIARNAAGTAASPIWSFTTGVSPAFPTLLSPANGATGVDPAQTLTWAPDNGATSYQVYLGTTSPPPQVASTSGTSYNAGTLNTNTLYYWSLIAANQFGQSTAPIWSFTTATCPASTTPSAVFLDSTSQFTTVDVTAFPGCAWSATAGESFIGIVSGGSGAGNGTVTISVPANTTGAALTGMLAIGALTVPVTQRVTPTTFTDVSPADYYFDFANLMYEKGITAGCLASPLEYCPNSTTTREEMAAFIITAVEGGNNFAYTPTPYFTDVPPSDPFFKFVQKLRDLGITGGCSATEFCPGNPVTRGEMAAFIIAARYGAAPYTYPAIPYFTDVPPTYLFFPFIQKAAQVGITTGCAPGLYCPDESLIRGQMAVFLVTGLLNELLAPGTPVIAAASPNAAAPGQAVTVTLAGVNTNFVQGTTQVVMAPGITPSNVTVTGGTSLTVQLSLDPTATLGQYSIVVTTGAEEAVLPNGFTVQ